MIYCRVRGISTGHNLKGWTVTPDLMDRARGDLGRRATRSFASLTKHSLQVKKKLKEKNFPWGFMCVFSANVAVLQITKATYSYVQRRCS